MIKTSIRVPHVFYTNELFVGKGSFMTVKNLEEKKFLIFVSKTVKSLENYQKIEKYLEGKSYSEEIIEDCSEKTILLSRDKYKDSKFDVLFAIGGGKVIDASKVIKFLIENPNHDLETLKKEYYNYNKRIKLVAVPTTPSTGSEANYIALIKNAQNKKVSFINRSFIPDMAILDVNFLLSLSREKLIQMTADIFGHSFESYFSLVSNTITKEYSKSCMNVLKDGVKGIKNDENDIKSFEKIMIAGYFGGMAIGNAFVGACHALAHAAESKIDEVHNNLILNLIKPILTWHQQKTQKVEYEQFLKDYQELGYDSYVEPGIFNNLDTDWWANAAIKDSSVRTNPVRMKLDSMLELVNWIKTR
ncbi:MAG: iron-containing alcohol dehydrogenase [Promethearchaeota archaeon]